MMLYTAREPVKCFYDDRDAVGLCKYCSRGLCHESAVSVGQALACEGRCEDEVRALLNVMARQRSVFQRTAAIYFRGAVLGALVGALFIGFTIVYQTKLGVMATLLGIMGVFFLVAAGIAFYNGWKFRRP
jgi:hypothetical protein